MSAPTGSPTTRVLGAAALAGMALLIPLGLVWSPADRRQSDGVRLLYVHVPSALLMYVSIGALVVGSVLWLRRRSVWGDLVGEAAAELALLFCGAVLATGMLWGKPIWGKAWVWDARLTSTALLAVLLAGQIALRRATVDPIARATRAAWMGLALLPNAVIIHYAVDWWRSLHQTATVRPTGADIEGLQLFTWLFAVAVFTVIWVWLMIHRFRVAWLTRQLEVEGLSVALDERRAEAHEGVG